MKFTSSVEQDIFRVSKFQACTILFISETFTKKYLNSCANKIGKCVHRFPGSIYFIFPRKKYRIFT